MRRSLSGNSGVVRQVLAGRRHRGLSSIPATAALLLVALLAGCDSGVVDPAMEEGGFLSVSAGAEHTCALSNGGSIYCWGSNRSGQLGTGSGDQSAFAVRVRGTERYAAVTAGGQHACALDAEGRLYCWGANQRGQLGNASRINQGVPVQIAPGLRFAHVSAGWFHTCALTKDAEAYCWGAAGQSQVGGEAGEDVLEPRLVATTRFATISAGGFHSCALDLQGRAYCWGANHHGQLGDGTTANAGAPRAVVGGGTYSMISAGYTHSCGISGSSTVSCWGSSDYGELGTGGLAVPGSAGATEPQAVHGSMRASYVDAGYYSSCLVAGDGWGWCWGRGDDGQLGTGSTWDYWTPQYVTAGVVSSVNIFFESLSVGLRHACGLTQERVVFCWGRGEQGQLGAGAVRYSAVPVRVESAR
jgi:alpha-tubulin suppressor-like RCC1 family protein